MNTTDSFNDYIAEAATKELPSSEDEEDIEDEDTCTTQQLAKEFPAQYTLDEASLSLKRDYVLGLSADSGFTRLAAGLSNTAVKIYDLNTSGTLRQIEDGRIPALKDCDNSITICGVRFLEENANTLLVGTTNGLVRLFDLRTTGEQGRFEYEKKEEAGLDALPQVPKSITTFDRNANSRILCCGTEQHMGNVYLLFFDVRERKQLGVYQDSHEDDVTSVLFHASNPDLLCTGGTDGLINVFDIQQPDEDEALCNTINTESSVHRLNWHRNVYEKDIVSCITHTNDFKSYECMEGDEVVSFERSDIVAGIRRKNPGNFNLINAHNNTDNGIFLLAGTNFNRGEILRSVTVPNKNTLWPLANYVDNKQIVRESLFDARRELLITGGESAIISIWSANADDTKNSNKLKTKSAVAKKHKKLPY